MKHKILILVSAFYLALQPSLQAQTGPDTCAIRFDNSLNNFIEKPKWCKEGTSVSFQVIHANPFALNSRLSATAINSDFQDGLDLVQSLTAVNQKEQTKTNQDASEVQKLMDSENNKDKKDSEVRIKTLNPIQDLLARKVVTRQKITEQFRKIDSARSGIDDVMVLDTFIVSLMNDPDIYSKEIMQAHIAHLARFKITATNDIYKDFQQHVDVINGILPNIYGRIEELKDINDSLKELNAKYAFDKYIDTLSKLTDKLGAVYSGTNLQKMKSKVSNIELNYERIDSTDFVIRSNKVITLKSDFLDIGDTLIDNKRKVYKVIEPVRIRSYGGVRVDFSAGLATTFGKVNGKDFFLLRDTANNVVGFDSSSVNRKFNFSPVAFAHLNFKLRSVVVPAISIGFNPDFNDFNNSKLLMGASVGFTATNNVLRRIVFSAGGTLGFTDVLKPKYKEMSDFSNLGSLSDSDLTQKALRFGGFMAVSFNFGNINNTQSK